MNPTDLIFDLDGTLVDSAGGILESFAATLSACNVEPQEPLNSNLIGPPLGVILKRLSGSSDPGLIRDLTDYFKSHYDSQGLLLTKAFPGTEEMLRTLHEQGFSLHIATNKRLYAATKIVDLCGWNNLFASLYALDMTDPPALDKANLLSRQIEALQLSPETTIYIGDRLDDGNAADQQSLDFYLAAWGYDESMSKVSDHWVVIETPDDLLRHTKACELSPR